MSLDFVAIDFETANELRTSACALAVVVFQKGEPVSQRSWLIRPPEEANYFNYFNTMIHGIHKDDVQNEKTFDEIWPEVHALIHGHIVVAHNASFDISVLRQLIARFELDCPEIDIVCSCNVAKRTWANHHNHKLDTMGKLLGIDFRHHDAQDDANTCGLVLVAAAKKHQATHLDEMARKIGMRIGTLSNEKYACCSIAKRP